MKEDLWAEWPDGYMCPISEVGEMLYPPLARSDDYRLIRITEYDGTGEPCSWMYVDED